MAYVRATWPQEMQMCLFLECKIMVIFSTNPNFPSSKMNYMTHSQCKMCLSPQVVRFSIGCTLEHDLVLFKVKIQLYMIKQSIPSNETPETFHNGS